MTEFRCTGNTIYRDNLEIAQISRSQNGIRTSAIEVTGKYNLRILRKDSSTFSIYRNGAEIGREIRGLIMEVDGQSYEIRRGDLLPFIQGTSDTVTIRNGDLEVGTITRQNGSLIAESDFNDEILILYLAFLSPYISARAIPTYFSGRTPVKREYRRLALLFGVISLVSIMIPVVYTKAPVLIMFALFVAFAVLSIIFRYLGRRKYVQEKNAES